MVAELGIHRHVFLILVAHFATLEALATASKGSLHWKNRKGYEEDPDECKDF